jgi:hypothetical protein
MLDKRRWSQEDTYFDSNYMYEMSRIDKDIEAESRLVIVYK